MKTVAVLCGGQSPEHQISLLSAESITKNLAARYQVFLFGIRQEDGQVVFHNDLIQEADNPKTIHLNPAATACNLEPGMIDGQKIDVVFPIVHGTTGEDGVLQGVCRFLQLPYVGAGVKASALAMDKHFTKVLLEQEKVPVAPYQVLRKDDAVPTYSEAIKTLGKELCIKPASLGSSVGVSLCLNVKDYLPAIEKAFEVDQKILLEKRILGREIEIGVLETQGILQVSRPSEIVNDPSSFYSYEAKYIDKEGAKLLVPAPLTADLEAKLDALAKKIFRALDLESMARIDFFLENDRFILNEVNTLPGFTSISMYPKMFEASGLSYPELLSRLIDNATLK